MNIENEIKKGGSWLRTARTWIQHNIRNGDSINWSSSQQVSVAFCDLEDFAKQVDRNA